MLIFSLSLRLCVRTYWDAPAKIFPFFFGICPDVSGNMKQFILTLAAVLTLGTFASADEWLTDYAKAMAQAKAQNRPVLVDFTGSDWCGWCMKLDREVFSMADFKNYAAAKLVLLKIDFPRRTPLPAAEQAQNEKLASQFGIQGFPTVIVLRPDGARAAQLGYMPGGPKAFISELEKIAPAK